MKNLPLEGVRVIGPTVVWAGPFVETILADWGAEVIRVEPIHFFPIATRGAAAARPPDFMAKMNSPIASYPDGEAGERPWNRCSIFNSIARNKLSMTLNLTKPKGVDIFKRLVAVSDMVIDNNTRGLMDRLGVGYSAVKEVKPDIIWISMTGYGNTGPYRDFRTMAAQLQSFVGHTLLRGYPDLDPRTTSSTYFADNALGSTAAFAAVVALHYRSRTGNGQFLDIAMSESMIPSIADAFMDYFMNGRISLTMGNRHRSAAPCGCYHCRGEDKWVSIQVSSDQDWQGLCRALGNPPWTKEARFADALSRWRNQDELDKLIEGWTLQHDHYEVTRILQKEGVPAGPVLDESEVFSDPHIKERGFFQELTQEDAGTHLYPGLLWRMADTPNTIRRPPVRLGEHNEYVYRQILKVSDEEYADLARDGHIGTEYGPGV